MSYTICFNCGEDFLGGRHTNICSMCQEIADQEDENINQETLIAVLELRIKLVMEFIDRQCEHREPYRGCSKPYENGYNSGSCDALGAVKQILEKKQ